MRKSLIAIFILAFLLNINLIDAQQKHPNLILTKKGIEKIRKDKDKYPVFRNTYLKVKNKIDSYLNKDIDVPLPKDAGGGYTHEKHKENYNLMYEAGILYQITQDEKYAIFIKNMLDKYAKMYPTLGKHPQAKIQTPGVLFWQTLNENVWLVHTIQAYDCIYDWLKPETRKLYEENIFIPMCKYFMSHEEEYNRIHNHGTWMVTAVGMTGIVIDNQKYVDYALHGTHLDDKGGFLIQLDKLFAPDGYYTEGPYYARYALWPFFLFAESLENNYPELKIYQQRNSILKKSLYALLQQTNTDGTFYPFNDALKEKSWQSEELVIASNLIYKRFDQDVNLLAIAKEHNRVMLNDAGLMVAKGLSELENVPDFEWKSVRFKDGAEGNMGGLAILRFGKKDDQSSLIFKYASHGLSHGHFDRLHFMFYEYGKEIIQDYGAARFLNIDQKFGGRYLKENKTYALQTVAHNTVVVDKKSQFNFNRKISEKSAPEEYAIELNNSKIKYVSAKENNAYKSVKLHRTLVFSKLDDLEFPLIVDIFKVSSREEHTYDLPFYFMGHIIENNINGKSFTEIRKPLGDDNGYQHLWVTKEGKSGKTNLLTFLRNSKFYSLLTATDENTDVYLTEIGAKDPEYNLRNDQGILFRRKAKNHVFASVLYSHGEFNPTLEYTKESYSPIKEVKVLLDNDEFTAVSFTGKKNINYIVVVVNNNPSKTEKHKLEIEGKVFEWEGPIFINNRKE